MKKIIILGAGESGIGAALLAKQQGYNVFVSDGGAIKEIYKAELIDNNISFEENKLMDNVIVIKKSRIGVNAYPIVAGFHTVQKGESWNLIAKKYGINQKDLCALNGTQKRYYLKPGQKIRVN